jgi:hypothetical protein
MTTLIGNHFTLFCKNNLFLIIGLVDDHVSRGQSVQSCLDFGLCNIGEVALGRNALLGREKVQYFLSEIAPGGLTVYRYGSTLSGHVVMCDGGLSSDAQTIGAGDSDFRISSLFL